LIIGTIITTNSLALFCKIIPFRLQNYSIPAPKLFQSGCKIISFSIPSENVSTALSILEGIGGELCRSVGEYLGGPIVGPSVF